MHLQAQVGQQTFDLVLDEGSVILDGRPVEARVNRLTDHTIHLILDNRSYVLTTVRQPDGTVRVTHKGRSVDVVLRTERDLLLERLGISTDEGSGVRDIRSPMPGLVLHVLVKEGEDVQQGAGLIVLEAMKMENELRAPAGATVGKVHVSPGDAVGKNDLLISFAE